MDVLVIIIGLVTVERELSKDFCKEAINTVCVRDENDDILLTCFLSAGSLLKFAGEFNVVTGQKYSSELFIKIWRNLLHQACVDKPDLSVDDIFQLVWQPCLQQCRQLLDSLINMNMKLSDVDGILEPHKTRLETQLQSLFKGISEISSINADPSLIEKAAGRVRDYWNLRRYQKGADIFLHLKTSLGLTKGDFRQVERLSQQVC